MLKDYQKLLKQFTRARHYKKRGKRIKMKS